MNLKSIKAKCLGLTLALATLTVFPFGSGEASASDIQSTSFISTDWVQEMYWALDDRDTSLLAKRLDADAVMHFNALPEFVGRDDIVAAFAGASAPWKSMNRTVTKVTRGIGGITAEGTFEAVDWNDVPHFFRFCSTFETHFVFSHTVGERGFFEVIDLYNLYIDL
jgi:hypothetical protein